MATMIQESMDSEYDDVRFPQERTQGLILGLTLEQVIVVLAGVLIGMAFILRGGPAMLVGIGLMAVIGAFGATRFRGRSLPGWVWVAMQYLRAGQRISSSTARGWPRHTCWSWWTASRRPR